MNQKQKIAVILCGGFGSRLSEQTQKIPKPMIKIGHEPILIHIMKIYSKYGITNFILALGYKKKKIIDFFQKFKNPNSWKINLVDTGLNTLTAKRLLKLKKYLLNEEFFFLTYGDGVANINLNRLLKFHLSHKKVATVTAVRPPTRFGELILRKNLVSKFDEKNQINSGWINGGFFVFNKNIFSFLPKKNTMLERATMKNLTSSKELMAFKHLGFWQCMDTLRDKNLLNKLAKQKKIKWL